MKDMDKKDSLIQKMEHIARELFPYYHLNGDLQKWFNLTIKVPIEKLQEDELNQGLWMCYLQRMFVDKIHTDCYKRLNTLNHEITHIIKGL